ncbi:MAG: DUF445 family protein [Spirochaetaceae bacterium]|jgi:uncharacterized membrane protein YheB (UPF0754 family)|nr:DUF445 family protein [Spirochaetaceae bacterium]
MNLNPFETCVSALSGGITGYVTNYLAVNMLFKKFGFWGGLIEARYAEFTDGISGMVETSLVNHKTLREEFSSVKFKTVLEEWLNSIIKDELSRGLGNTCLEDIPGAKAGAEAVLDLIENMQDAFFYSLFNIIKNESAGVFISNEQCVYTAKALSKETLNLSSEFENLINDFFCGKSLTDLFSVAFIKKTSDNLSAAIKQNGSFAQEEDFNLLYSAFINAADAGTLLNELQTNFMNMRFIDFLEACGLDKNNLKKNVIDFIQTKEGHEFLCAVAGGLFLKAQNTELKLSSILTGDFCKVIVKLCSEKKNELIDKIVDFINESEDELESIINSTIDDELEKRLDGKIAKFFKNSFIENISAKTGIINKIRKAILKYKSDDGFADKITAFIKEKTTADIFFIAQDAGLINADIILSFLTACITSAEAWNSGFINDFLQKKTGAFFDSGKFSADSAALLNKIFNKINKKYLCSKQLNNAVADYIETKAAGFNIPKIHISLDGEKIFNTALYFLNAALNKEIIFFTGERPQLPRFKRETVELVWSLNKKRLLMDFFTPLEKNKNRAVFSGAAAAAIVDNLEQILSTRVSGAVNTELSKLKPAEINILAHDFMGSEMRPITIFGAALGLIAGIFAVIIPAALKTPPVFNFTLLGINALIFAFAGIATNWLAIKMLFRPYKPLFRGAKTPPFIALSAARKPQFAKNTAVFVSKKLLNTESLTQYYKNNKSDLKKYFDSKLSAENYSLCAVFNLNDKNIPDIGGKISNAAHNYIVQHSENLAASFCVFFNKLVSSGIPDEFLQKLSGVILKKLKENGALPAAARFLEKNLRSKEAKDFKEAFNFAPAAAMITETITPLKIKSFIEKKEGAFAEWKTKRSVKQAAQTLDIPAKNEFNTGHFEIILKELLNKFESELFNSDKKLSEIYGRILTRLLENNMNVVINKIQSAVFKNKADIKSNIKNSIPLAVPFSFHTDNIVDKLVDIELPRFLRSKKHKLNAVFQSLLEVKLSDLNLPEKLAEKDIIAKEFAKYALPIFIDNFGSIQVSSALSLINMNSTEELCHFFMPYIEKALVHINRNLKQDERLFILEAPLKNIFSKLVCGISCQNILEGTEAERELQNLFEKISCDKIFINNITKITETLLSRMLSNSSFYNEELLKKDALNFINYLTGNSSSCRLEKLIVPFVNKIIPDLDAALNTEIKTAVISEYLLNAIIDSAERHIPALVAAIDIGAVVEREINALHPLEIEKLFYSFAGPYFKKITFYGWIGSFGGALSYWLSH